MLRVMRQQQHLMVMIVVNGIHMRCCACYILACYTCRLVARCAIRGMDVSARGQAS